MRMRHAAARGAASPVSTPELDTLIAAVRRRLRRERLRDAIRRGCWVTALLLTLAAAVHLALYPLPVAGVAAAVAIGWTLWAGTALLRHDRDAECARWADRRLDGASAYETLLEQRVSARVTPACTRLQGWAAARVPHSLQRLAGLPAQVPLARPLATLGVAGLLAAVLLALPGRTTSPAPAAASAEPGRGVRPQEAPDRDAASPLVTLRPDRSLDEITRAARGLARSGPHGDDPTASRTGPGAASSQDPPRADRAADATAPSRPGDPAQAAAQRARGLPAATDLASTPPPAASGLPGAAGVEAGRSADDRAVVGVSRALPGPLVVQRSRLGPRATEAGGMQASDEAGEHLDTSASPMSAPAAAPAAPPAAAPPAFAENRMTPAETHYVRAWARALGLAR